jgi:hypothetical protein
VDPNAENPTTGSKQGLTLGPVDEGHGKQLPALAANSLQVLIASPQRLQFALDNLRGFDEMHSLHEQVAAWEGVQKRMAAATEDLIRIASVRLRLERKIGGHLLETVRRGGHGSKSNSRTSNRGGASAGLPLGISKQRASWYRSIARIPTNVFEAFLAHRAGSGRPPTARALLNCVPKAGVGTIRPPKRTVRFSAPQAETPPEADAGGVSTDILDAVARLMDVDVVVGGARSAWPQAVHLEPETLMATQVGGNVVVAACSDPSAWLPSLSRARTAARVCQVVVVLPPVGWADWFKQLENGGWFCCFTSRALVAYCGERTHAFTIVFDEIGTVLGPSG